MAVKVKKEKSGISVVQLLNAYVYFFYRIVATPQLIFRQKITNLHIHRHTQREMWDIAKGK